MAGQSGQIRVDTESFAFGDGFWHTVNVISILDARSLGLRFGDCKERRFTR